MADTPNVPAEAQPGEQALHHSQHHPHKKRTFWQRHSLSIVSIVIVTIWILAYRYSNPDTHLGSFFGNAIADWTGVVVTVLGTKWLFEKNSRESRRPPKRTGGAVVCALWDHSLSIFLLITGIGWVVLFARMDATSKWGDVVGNIVSEWTQTFGMVLMTKRLIEWKSKE